ncbi:MAG: hypothetical protein AAGH64_00250 [Planctomycetota bacterium]
MNPIKTIAACLCCLVLALATTGCQSTGPNNVVAASAQGECCGSCSGDCTHSCCGTAGVQTAAAGMTCSEGCRCTGATVTTASTTEAASCCGSCCGDCAHTCCDGCQG